MMTNAEKYKTPEERYDNFFEFVKGSVFADERTCVEHAFKWLEMEYPEEKPLPCPYCGQEHILIKKICGYAVMCSECEYHGKFYDTREEAISNHNRIANGCNLELTDGEKTND